MNTLPDDLVGTGLSLAKPKMCFRSIEKKIHPSIHSFLLVLMEVVGRLKPIPATIGQEGGKL